MYDEIICGIPGAELFLDSVDQVSNGNTFLLQFRAAPFRAESGGPAELFKNLIDSNDFSEAMYQCDLMRNWQNYHVFNIDDHGTLHWRRRQGSWVKPDTEVSLQLVTRDVFESRLHWLLTKVFSPYDRHIEPIEAEKVVANFLEALKPFQGEWHYYFVEPNFLHPTGYWTGPDDLLPHPLAYFDGAEADTVTFFHNPDTLFILLTNGRA